MKKMGFFCPTVLKIWSSMPKNVEYVFALDLKRGCICKFFHKFNCTWLWRKNQKIYLETFFSFLFIFEWDFIFYFLRKILGRVEVGKILYTRSPLLPPYTLQPLIRRHRCSSRNRWFIVLITKPVRHSLFAFRFSKPYSNSSLQFICSF